MAQGIGADEATNSPTEERIFIAFHPVKHLPHQISTVRLYSANAVDDSFFEDHLPEDSRLLPD